MFTKASVCAALALLASASAQRPGQHTWGLCEGSINYYPCSGCKCSAATTQMQRPCSLVDLGNGNTFYGFLLQSSTSNEVGICGAPDRQTCLETLEMTFRSPTGTGFPPHNTTAGYECLGQPWGNSISSAACANEAKGSSSFSVQISCAARPNTTTPPPTSPAQCADKSPAVVQSTLQRLCHNQTNAICSAQNCDEIASTLAASGQRCFPVLQELCCQSCKNPGGGNDTRTCEQNTMTCARPLYEMFEQSQGGSCCPALQQPITAAGFSNAANVQKCAACAHTNFGSNLGTCSCCVAPILQRFTPTINVPASFMEGVFGQCQH